MNYTLLERASVKPYNKRPYRVFCNEQAPDRKVGAHRVIVV